MKKKIIIGTALIAVFVLGGVTTYAATYELGWTKNIYNISQIERGFGSSGSVSVFDDGDNKCYVVSDSNVKGISCVKR